MCKSKLMPRSDGPSEILEKIAPNAYKVDLPSEYGVSTNFNVADLSHYDEDDELPSSRSNSNQAKGGDGDHPLEPSEDHPTSQQELSSTKEVKEVHALVRSFPNQPYCLPSSSSENWPKFVRLVEQATESVEVCHDHSPQV